MHQRKDWILAIYRYLMATKICFNLIFLIKDTSQRHDALTKFTGPGKSVFFLKLLFIVDFSVLFLKTMLYFLSWIVVYDEYVNGFILIRSYRSNFKVHKIVTKKWVGINYQLFCLNCPWRCFKYIRYISHRNFLLLNRLKYEYFICKKRFYLCFTHKNCFVLEM